VACVANAYDLAGDGIKKVVWGALAERRQEIKQLFHAILDALEIQAAYDDASFAAVGVWGGGGVGGVTTNICSNAYTHQKYMPNPN